MAKTKRRTVSTRNSMAFLVTFVIFLLLFGGLMLWGVGEFWKQTAADKDTATTPTTAAPTGYTEADKRRLLIVTEDNGTAQGFVLLETDPAAGRIRVVAVPRETAVTVGVTSARLFELYATDGVGAAMQQVGALFGYAVDNYAVVSYDGLQRIVSYLGDGVVFTLNEAVSYESDTGATVNMKSGARTLTAPQVTDLLRYTGWHNGRRARADVQGELIAAMINQYLTPSRFNDADTDFHALTNLSRSDILVSQFAELRPSLLYLARKNQGDLCTVVSPPGDFIGTGAAMRFEPTEASAAP